MAVQIDLIAFKRVPFGGSSGEADFFIVGFDYSTALFAMQVRPSWGDTATPLVSLTSAAAGLQGMSATYEVAYAMPDTGEIVSGTRLRPQIDEATMDALALAAAPEDTLRHVYDIHVTPTGLSKKVLCFGNFLIAPGSTI